MKLYDLVNNGLANNLDRLCGTSVTNYSFKDKISDLNESLDWYFDIAEKASSNWNFDDSNNTTPPIDTQDIVSGTNRYKFSAFTEEITDLLRLEVLNSSGVGQPLFPETLDTFGNIIGNTSGQISGVTSQTFQETYLNAPSGLPTNYIKYGGFVYLRPKPNYNYTAGLKAYFNRPASKFSFVAVVANVDNTLTAASHGLVANDTVIFETDGTIPTGLTADTQYYVISSGLTSSVFKVSATLGGTEIDITNAQSSSNHSFLKTNKSPGINSMHHPILYRKAAATFMQFNNANGEYNARLSGVLPQLQSDERIIGAFYARRDKDVRHRLTPKYQNNR